eukprot:CAMPEP_0167792526 /NCGR_PEP_ID=MMETSP0111_2-20121227/12611_1 /TAXON_ID=91324 /ORGANISM="Lotharella globosa, Strain CCCM811" /LENGTH=298 /DNA_ID=CAMNT_0007685457 /DNA_START=17 /DNA_END=913 /DNA_ORIENTATION=+
MVPAGRLLLLAGVALAHWKPSQRHIVANQTDASVALKGDENVRTGIFVFAAPFSGSTAMLQLLMSAGVQTQCRNLKWECEEFRAYDDPHMPVMKKLEVVAGNWDLGMGKDHALLFHKVGIPNAWTLGAEDSSFKHILEKRPLPEAFTKHGINEIDAHVILLWQPHCLHNYLSSHGARPDKEYIEFHQTFLNAERVLRERGMDVTVVNFGDLIFKPDHVNQQLAHIPNLPKLDFDFVPTLGKDIFVENEFKAQGSIADYAIHVKQHEAAKHYNAELGTCLDAMTNPVQKLESELARMSS